MVQWESENELNAFRLLDASPEVLSFSEQPVVIKFILDGENLTHYPDVLVQYRNGRELWEIKPKSEATKPDVLARTLFMQAALPAFGFTYQMVLACDLGRNPRMDNILMLLKYGRKPVSDLAREHIRRLLIAAPSLQWHSAANGDLGPNGRAHLARLALEGYLSLDLNSLSLRDATFYLNDSTRKGA